MDFGYFALRHEIICSSPIFNKSRHFFLVAAWVFKVAQFCDFIAVLATLGTTNMDRIQPWIQTQEMFYSEDHQNAENIVLSLIMHACVLS